MFWECFHFNCRIHMRTAAFLLAAAASIVFSAVSQLPYFEHYQLTSASDLEQISERLPTDATVPASSREQLQLTVESTRRILTRELRLPDSDDILSKLQERLSVKTDWSVRELDELWEELVSEHGGLVMLSPRYLSNSFIGHSRKPASLEELVQYAYSGHDFSDFLSVEFGQSLSLINAILFSVFFSALFLDDVKQGMSDILHINVSSPRRMVYGKYLSALALATGCICLDIIGVNIMQLLYVRGTTLRQLSAVWGSALLYSVPTIVFLSSVSVLLCVLFKNAAPGIAALLLANFISGYSRMLPDDSRRQLFIAPFIANMNSFFTPVSREEFTAILFNRAAFCLAGIAMLELTVQVWKRHKGAKSVRRPSRRRFPDSSLFSPKGFLFYNGKIILSRVKLAALLVIFSMPCLLANADSELIDISRSILLMTGWASVLLFSNIKSVEYTDNTIDLYRLSPGKRRAIAARFFVCVMTVMLFTTGVFLLGLLRVNPNTYRFEYVADAFIRMTISCVSCACFLGSVTMTAGRGFQKAWPGLLTGLTVNVLLSRIRTASIFNLYWFYSFPGSEGIHQWLLSICFYVSVSLAVLMCDLYLLQP